MNAIDALFESYSYGYITKDNYDLILKGLQMSAEPKYTYDQAVSIAQRMGSCEPQVLIRVLQIFELLTLKAEEEGLPLNFKFPFANRDDWTHCCNELRKQGWKIIKEE